jgi:hypothetical protein
MATTIVAMLVMTVILEMLFLFLFFFFFIVIVIVVVIVFAFVVATNVVEATLKRLRTSCGFDHAEERLIHVSRPSGHCDIDIAIFVPRG